MMGNQGAELEPQTNYPGQRVYKDTWANRRAGRVGQPKKKSGEGGAGGARKGAGRKPIPSARAFLPSENPSEGSTSTSSSFGSRLRKAFTKPPRIAAQTKGTTLKLKRPKGTPLALPAGDAPYTASTLFS